MLPQHARQFLSACRGIPLREWKKFAQLRHSMLPQKRKLPGFSYFMLTIPATAFFLGTWQVKRRSWKLALIKELEEKTSELSVDLPLSLEDLQTMEYRKVRVTGEFDHSREMYIEPRSLVENSDERKGILGSSPKTGAWVVTPFILDDRDWTILVNRGWVPRKKIEPGMRLEGQITGKIELIGIVRHEEKRLPFQTKNSNRGKENVRRWLRRDLPGMAEMAQTQPVFIDAVAESTVKGGPIGGQTRVTLRNDHLSYIFTWYALSAATSYMWFKRYAKGISI